jgi:universal stress protein E
VVDLRADLLVMGPHRRALFKDVFVGTTLERVLRRVGVPVLVANRDGSADYRHVLVAVDLSVDSAAALAAAKALGLLQAVPIEILHVFDPMARGLVSMATHSPQAVEHYVAMSRQEASDALAAFLSTVDFAGVEYTVRVLEGPPAATITQAAQGAGLVVVGTRGRTGAARVFLGSVAEFVVRSVDADVLVARAVRD